MNVAIIPARGGSVRIPRKNIRPFHGKPIIEYSIETAKASALFGKVIVSTDDEEIVGIAERCGAAVHRRHCTLGADAVGTQEVARDALLHVEDCEYACCIYATAPLLTPAYLRLGLDLLQQRGSRFAFSVGTVPLRDAGQFYWGGLRSFLLRHPLYDDRSTMVPIPSERVCDINTPHDWHMAEQMYAALHQEEA